MIRSAARSAFAHGTRLETIQQSCIDQLDGLVDGPGLGLVYMTRGFEPVADELLARLSAATNTKDWIGASADAVIGGGKLLSNEAVALTILPLAAGDYQLVDRVPDQCRGLGLIHATLERDSECRLDSGLMASGMDCVGAQISDGVHLCNALLSGGFSGACLHPAIQVSTVINRALKPAGPKRKLTCSYGSVIAGIEGGDPIASLVEDAGELLIRSPSVLKDHILASLSDERSSGNQDHLEIAAIEELDRGAKRLQLDQTIRASHIQFARRDPIQGLNQLSDNVKKAAAKLDRISAVLYYMSSRRGERLFGPGSDELSAIRSVAGQAPIIGLVSDREIFRSRDEFCSSVVALIGDRKDQDDGA